MRFIKTALGNYINLEKIATLEAQGNCVLATFDYRRDFDDLQSQSHVGEYLPGLIGAFVDHFEALEALDSLLEEITSSDCKIIAYNHKSSQNK